MHHIATTWPRGRSSSSLLIHIAFSPMNNWKKNASRPRFNLSIYSSSSSSFFAIFIIIVIILCIYTLDASWVRMRRDRCFRDERWLCSFARLYNCWKECRIVCVPCGGCLRKSHSWLMTHDSWLMWCSWLCKGSHFRFALIMGHDGPPYSYYEWDYEIKFFQYSVQHHEWHRLLMCCVVVQRKARSSFRSYSNSSMLCLYCVAVALH